MSYSINISKYLEGFESFINLTVENLPITKSILDQYDFKTAEEFEESDCFYQWQDSYHPIYNFAHILSNQMGTWKQTDRLQNIIEHAPNVSIIRIDEIGSDLITLNGCGMDMSDSIAYAYMIIDRYVPRCIRPTDRMTLSKNSWRKLQDFIKKQGVNR